VQQWQEAANKGDAATIAGLYASNAVAVFSEGIFHDPQAIQADLAAQFKGGWTNIKLTDTEDHSQGDWAWSIGNWSSDFGTQPISGYWSALCTQQGTAWKMQQHTVVTNHPGLEEVLITALLGSR